MLHYSICNSTLQPYVYANDCPAADSCLMCGQELAAQQKRAPHTPLLLISMGESNRFKSSNASDVHDIQTTLTQETAHKTGSQLLPPLRRNRSFVLLGTACCKRHNICSNSFLTHRAYLEYRLRSVQQCSSAHTPAAAVAQTGPKCFRS